MLPANRGEGALSRLAEESRSSVVRLLEFTKMVTFSDLLAFGGGLLLNMFLKRSTGFMVS